MRNALCRTLVTLAVMAPAAAALGATAAPASADVPNPAYSNGGYAGFDRSYACSTLYRFGVNHEYGAWGEFMDGCTVKLTCPFATGLTIAPGDPNDVQGCDVIGNSFIDNYNHVGQRVTMNARTRRYDAGGHLYAYKDGSCDQPDHCEVDDTGSVIAPGQSASVQCNGVRSVTSNEAEDHCMVTLKYRHLDRVHQQGSGECTDWALYRRPDLAGVVSGNAQAWTNEAIAAGRTVSKTPTAGSLMVLQPGILGAGVPTGHVAYVESVGAGSFTVTEQNWNGIKTPTYRTIQTSTLPASGVDFIG